MRQLKLIRLLVVVFCGLLMMNPQAFAAANTATNPMQTIKKANNELAEAIKKSKTTAAAIAAVTKVLENVSDFEGMADNVTASYCEKLEAKQCKEFKETFIELIKVSTAGKLKNYKSEKVNYNKSDIDGNSAKVQTSVKAGDNEVNIDYVLQKKNGKWYIVNYIVEDIDTINNYKKQFKRLFKKNSFTQVMDNLNKKISKIKSGK